MGNLPSHPPSDNGQSLRQNGQNPQGTEPTEPRHNADNVSLNDESAYAVPPPYTELWLDAMPEILRNHLQNKNSPEFKSLPTCEPCRKAQSQPHYFRRITSLLSIMYCSKCEIEHSIIFFSPRQRQAEPRKRQCIAYEGIFEACPHLQFNLAQIQRLRHDRADWFAENSGNEHTWTCDLPECPFNPRVIITLTSIKTKWEIHVDNNVSDAEFWQSCMNRLNHLVKSAPQGFCPHIRASPYRLADPISLAHNRMPTVRLLRCQSCISHIVIYKDAAKIILSTFIERDTQYGDFDHSWLAVLSTDSYQLFEDLDTKHITWCDDRLCDTAFELQYQNSYLQILAMKELAITRQQYIDEGDELWIQIAQETNYYIDKSLRAE